MLALYYWYLDFCFVLFIHTVKATLNILEYNLKKSITVFGILFFVKFPVTMWSECNSPSFSNSHKLITVSEKNAESTISTAANRKSYPTGQLKPSVTAIN